MSSIPDKDPMRPKVPDVKVWLDLYYELPENSNGGSVHIIIEDQNCSQSHADWCVANSHTDRFRHSPIRDNELNTALTLVDIYTAEILASMTKTQRTIVSSDSYYPNAGSSNGPDTRVDHLRDAGSIPAPAIAAMCQALMMCRADL